MLKRSMVLARKELHEAFRSRIIKYSFVGMGFLFGFIIPLIFGLLGAIIGSMPVTGTSLSNLPIPADFFSGFTDAQRSYLFFQYIIVSLMLLIAPVALPTYISADSFAGEKERKTIQQLLSTPLTDSEILLGKILTGFIPTIITTYLCVLSTAVILNLSWWHVYGTFQLIYPNLSALLQLVFLYPLLTFFSILIIIWASARASKMMEAAQVGGIVVLPVLIIGLAPLLVGGLGNVYFALATIAVFAVLDWRLFKFSSKKFTREAILGKL